PRARCTRHVRHSFSPRCPAMTSMALRLLPGCAVRPKSTKERDTIMMKVILAGAAIAVLLLGGTPLVSQATAVISLASDPGVRCGDLGAGGAIRGLTPTETSFFATGQEDFEEAEGVSDGLGPRFNLDRCAGCHAHPAVGGTSPAPFIPSGPGCTPAPNPQV